MGGDCLNVGCVPSKVHSSVCRARPSNSASDLPEEPLHCVALRLVLPMIIYRLSQILQSSQDVTAALSLLSIVARCGTWATQKHADKYGRCNCATQWMHRSTLMIAGAPVCCTLIWQVSASSSYDLFPSPALPCSCYRFTPPSCLKQALIACATRLHEVQTSAEFGVELPGKVGVDFGKVMKRMRRIRSEISEVSLLPLIDPLL